MLAQWKTLHNQNNNWLSTCQKRHGQPLKRLLDGYVKHVISWP